MEKIKSSLHDKQYIDVHGISKGRIKDRYKFGKSLGEGGFGQVRLATLLDDECKKFAIKSIPREKL